MSTAIPFATSKEFQDSIHLEDDENETLLKKRKSSSAKINEKANSQSMINLGTKGTQYIHKQVGFCGKVILSGPGFYGWSEYHACFKEGTYLLHILQGDDLLDRIEISSSSSYRSGKMRKNTSSGTVEYRCITLFHPRGKYYLLTKDKDAIKKWLDAFRTHGVQEIGSFLENPEIMCGMLEKRGKLFGMYSPLRFILYNNYEFGSLYFYKARKDKDSYQGEMLLDSDTIIEFMDHKKPHNFSLINSEKSIHLAASNEKEKNQWIEAIQQSINRK